MIYATSTATDAPQPAPRKFQFGLRSFLLFALVAAPLTAWIANEILDLQRASPAHPASGTVLHASGAPLVNGTVTFRGLTGKSYASTATTAANGGFILSTFEENDGAVPDDYSVDILDANGKLLLTARATVAKGKNVYRFIVP